MNRRDMKKDGELRQKRNGVRFMSQAIDFSIVHVREAS